MYKLVEFMETNRKVIICLSMSMDKQKVIFQPDGMKKLEIQSSYFPFENFSIFFIEREFSLTFLLEENVFLLEKFSFFFFERKFLLPLLGKENFFSDQAVI